MVESQPYSGVGEFKYLYNHQTLLGIHHFLAACLYVKPTQDH